MPKVLKCPACKAAVSIAEGTRPAGFPFCSERCRMSDLGRWFEGEYKMPQPIGPDDHEAIEEVIRHQLAEA